MKNKGVEGNLNVKVINTDDFNLSLNGNIAYNIGEITDLNNRTTNVDNASNIPVGTGQKIAYNTVDSNLIRLGYFNKFMIQTTDR